MATLDARRIGLNAHLLNLSGNYRSAGINWYIYHLLQNLPDPSLDLTVFSGEVRAQERLPKLRVIQSRLRTHNPFVRIAWEQLVQPFALDHNRIELLHALAFAGPVVLAIPWIVTVYDLSFVLFPASFNALNRLYLKWAVGDAMRRASKVIAISECTRRDLITHMNAEPSKVVVVHCGFDPSFAPSEENSHTDMLRARYHLPDKFILHVGTLEPRKNVVRLIHAFARAKRAARLPHALVLAGARGWKYSHVDAAIEQEGIAESICRPGYIPQDELPMVYRAADLLVYPSLYEGFGLPPLEAMASGTPVVSSNAASLPEVVGDAALMIPPEDESALTEAIVRALGNGALREQMRERGLRQASHFSWTQAARETRAVYHAVLAGAN